MKTFLTFIVFLQCILPAFSCTCFPPSYCDYYEQIKDNETTLIFKGSYIKEDQIGNGSKAMEFKVEEIYKGEIVTENSIYYTGETFINTDSSVWLLSGSEASCLRFFDEATAIFVVTYNPTWSPISENFGYVPTICKSDYFPISSNEEISGWIWESEDITIPLSEFETMLEQGCMISYLENSTDEFDQLNVHPNPVKEVLNIESNYYGEELKMELYDTKGRLVKRIEESSVDLNELSPGIYFFIATFRNSTYTKKVVKM